MPALPAVPGVLKTVINWQVEGDALASNVMHWSISGSPTAANCANMGITIGSWAQNDFQALCSNYVGVLEVICTDLSASGAQGAGPSPWVGTAGTDLLAPGTSVVVNHSIARRYRGGKPKTFLPIGVSTDVATTGLWKTASVAAFDTAFGAFVGHVKSSGDGCSINNLVNLSYYDGFRVVTSPITGRARNVPTLRGTPVVDIITVSSVSKVIGSQRRRNRDA